MSARADTKQRGIVGRPAAKTSGHWVSCFFCEWQGAPRSVCVDRLSGRLLRSRVQDVATGDGSHGLGHATVLPCLTRSRISKTRGAISNECSGTVRQHLRYGPSRAVPRMASQEPETRRRARMGELNVRHARAGMEGPWPLTLRLHCLVLECRRGQKQAAVWGNSPCTPSNCTVECAGTR